MNKEKKASVSENNNLWNIATFVTLMLLWSGMIINLYFALILIIQAYGSIRELINEAAGFVSYETAIIALIILIISLIEYATIRIMRLGVNFSIETYYRFNESL
jgi:hypothetical protein